jgi:hypothetical protein
MDHNSFTFDQRNALNYLRLLVGEDALVRIGAKVTEVERAWGVAIPHATVNKPGAAREIPDEKRKAWTDWHAWQLRWSTGRSSIDELNAQVAAVNRFSGKPIETLAFATVTDRLALITHRMEAIEKINAELTAKINALSYVLDLQKSTESKPANGHTSESSSP